MVEYLYNAATENDIYKVYAMSYEMSDKMSQKKSIYIHTGPNTVGQKK